MLALTLPPAVPGELPPAAYVEGGFEEKDGYPDVIMMPATVDSIATMNVTAAFLPEQTGKYGTLRLVLLKDGTPMMRTTVRILPEDKTFVTGAVTLTVRIPADHQVLIHSDVELGDGVPLNLYRGMFTASRIAAQF